MSDITPPLLVKEIFDALENKKGLDIRVLDVRGLSTYTDFLILCSGSSSTHVAALATAVGAILEKNSPFCGNASKDDSWWVLDFFDVVVHVFKEDTRRFYDLEGLWGDAERMT